VHCRALLYSAERGKRQIEVELAESRGAGGQGQLALLRQPGQLMETPTVLGRLLCLPGADRKTYLSLPTILSVNL